MADVNGELAISPNMEKYQDTPMDLADASLVATAEPRELRRVFTLDSHFRAYRAHDKEPFEVVP